MPEKPKATEAEIELLKKAKEAEDTGSEIRVSGDDAALATKLMLSGVTHSWGGDHWGPGHDHWPHHPYGPGPYVRGWHDGNDIVLGGITTAGLMVLNSWLNPQPEYPPEPPPQQPPVTVNVNVPPSGPRSISEASDLPSQSEPPPDSDYPPEQPEPPKNLQVPHPVVHRPTPGGGPKPVPKAQKKAQKAKKKPKKKK